MPSPIEAASSEYLIYCRARRAASARPAGLCVPVTLAVCLSQNNAPGESAGRCSNDIMFCVMKADILGLNPTPVGRAYDTGTAFIYDSFSKVATAQIKPRVAQVVYDNMILPFRSIRRPFPVGPQDR